MTITADIDAAIADEMAKRSAGKRARSMCLRVGPGARHALLAAADPEDIIIDKGDPHSYREIKIELVASPWDIKDAPTRERFHGWELRT